MGKALAYTTFALLASSMILALAAFPVVNSDEGSTTSERIGEAAFFLETVTSDMDRALRIATRRAISSAANYVVENGEPLQNPAQNLTSLAVNGTVAGERREGMGNATLKVWKSRVSDIASRSGYSIELEVTNYTLETQGMQLEASFQVFTRLKDPVARTAFNRTVRKNAAVSIAGSEDTMLLLRSRGRYVNKYTRCSFDVPAEQLYQGTQGSNGYVQGYAEKNPGDPQSVSNISSKILVVDDADSYQPSAFDGYAGIVSADESSYNDTVTQEYVFGTGSISRIRQNESLILEEERVWRSNFGKMIETGCYISDPRGPGYLDRLSNNLTSEEGGIATLIDVSRLPQELQFERSSVGYVYFNSSGYGPVNQVQGVTDRYPWFRLDRFHVEYWDLGELVE
ncbi:MAG: hypothetical protein ABEJ98_02155 [Candidatus Nanohaloarchaea archaeon]